MRHLYLWTPLLILSFIVPLLGCSGHRVNIHVEKNELVTQFQLNDQRKDQFQEQFAEQCIEKEIANSINKDVDRARFTKPCFCIAQHMMKDLNIVDAEKFLLERKTTQSMRIRFERAAYFCLQKKKQPKTADLFGRK